MSEVFKSKGVISNDVRDFLGVIGELTWGVEVQNAIVHTLFDLTRIVDLAIGRCSLP